MSLGTQKPSMVATLTLTLPYLSPATARSTASGCDAATSGGTYATLSVDWRRHALDSRDGTHVMDTSHGDLRQGHPDSHSTLQPQHAIASISGTLNTCHNITAVPAVRDAGFAGPPKKLPEQHSDASAAPEKKETSRARRGAGGAPTMRQQESVPQHRSLAKRTAAPRNASGSPPVPGSATSCSTPHQFSVSVLACAHTLDFSLRSLKPYPPGKSSSSTLSTPVTPTPAVDPVQPLGWHLTREDVNEAEPGIVVSDRLVL